MNEVIEFQTDPSRYLHWRVSYDGDVARVVMDVDETGGLFEGYELKLNSYDLGVDIELADIVQRMRFEHPEVRVVVLSSVNRVRPPGPGSTASSGTSGSATADEPSSTSMM